MTWSAPAPLCSISTRIGDQAGATAGGAGGALAASSSSRSRPPNAVTASGTSHCTYPAAALSEAKPPLGSGGPNRPTASRYSPSGEQSSPSATARSTSAYSRRSASGRWSESGIRSHSSGQ